MAKSLGTVAVATRRIAVNYYKRFDLMMKSGSLHRVISKSI